jgi:hypothetical protein
MAVANRDQSPFFPPVGMSYFGLATNLVYSFMVELHTGSKLAATSVTNWVGTASMTLISALLSYLPTPSSAYTRP